MIRQIMEISQRNFGNMIAYGSYDRIVLEFVRDNIMSQLI